MALARNLAAKIYEIKAHNANVTCLGLGETGRVLVTGGQDRTINLWAIGQDECFMSLTSHNRPIDCVRFAYNDDFVYSADDIGIIRRWDLNAQTICSTLNGHMKSVRTLDFNPSGEYVVSGSNDTTVRLWDVRNQNKCIKIYRGHIAYVNSVKFSPDGLWIASAGTEGSVIIWDIRKSKQIKDFTEQPPAAGITCIQFHPSEFLLAVGRVDGTVNIYDLENNERILSTNASSQFYGNPVKCITFSENGECLFVGTAAGISVIGWEPDREFDYIKSTWTEIGDIKVVKRKLICGTYESDTVSINALSIDRVFPFYNPSNIPSTFNSNSSVRRSFSRGNQKLRLSIGGPKPSRVLEENEDNKSPSLDEQSSPNLSLELVDDTNLVITMPPPIPSSSTHPLNGYGNGNGNGNGTLSVKTNLNNAYNIVTNFAPSKSVPMPYNFPSIPSSTDYNMIGSNGYNSLHFDGPSSLKVPGEHGMYPVDRIFETFGNGVEYNLNDSNTPIISNYDHNEMAEDFPVNQNVHQQQNVVSSTNVSSQQTSKTTKTKQISHIQKRNTQNAISGSKSATSSFHNRNKFSQVSSVSTTDLHKLDDNLLIKKSASSHMVAKGRRNTDAQSQINKENARNKNITVQILTKPPTRSRTSFDLRSPESAAAHKQSHIPVSYRPDPSLLTQSGVNQKSLNNRNGIDDSSEIHMLSTSHEQVYQELSNRHATLQLIRNSTRSHDVIGALRQAIQMNGRTVFVDLLGAILEKTSSWNLDLCLLILPEIFELLKSQHKFHYTRACDTLRVILSNFLPIIQDNIDPWAANNLGVDVSREERQRKCIECQHWLLQIRNLPETSHFGTSLTQLQSLIVNI
ncbi:katanin p80 WD40 repeat-containing subunit B1 isoform X2 [Teleopsis dalmanni]|uniref:katanin p80 WD40 repeat-containing subunit B1 isoform X2 n=1 Tax=Teleopsis dalmanni TaxID=139649 RepID=UPI0018CF57E2|nr:katanin p80 WD40 repeat-containing subunit B1 isoform X2 [Teleopsis dalmanni]